MNTYHLMIVSIKATWSESYSVTSPNWAPTGRILRPGAWICLLKLQVLANILLVVLIKSGLIRILNFQNSEIHRGLVTSVASFTQASTSSMKGQSERLDLGSMLFEIDIKLYYSWEPERRNSHLGGGWGDSDRVGLDALYIYVVHKQGHRDNSVICMLRYNIQDKYSPPPILH